MSALKEVAECKEEWSRGTKQWKMAVLGSAFGFLIATQFEMKNPKCYKFPALALYPLRAADKGFLSCKAQHDANRRVV